MSKKKVHNMTDLLREELTVNNMPYVVDI